MKDEIQKNIDLIEPSPVSEISSTMSPYESFKYGQTKYFPNNISTDPNKILDQILKKNPNNNSNINSNIITNNTSSRGINIDTSVNIPNNGKHINLKE